MNIPRGAAVVFQPAVQASIQRGIEQIVAPIRPTLGPLTRTVVLSTSFPGEVPEILEKGSLIARRITALTDPDADMGAMLVRSLLWRLHKTVGDCTATAAVLCQSVYDDGMRYLTAGGNAIKLKAHLHAGMQIMLRELDRLTVTLHGIEAITHFAQSVGDDAELSSFLGEIFDTLGPFAQIDIRTGQKRDTTRHYVEGAYWKGGVHSSSQLPSGKRVELTNPAFVLTDLSIDDPWQAARLIEAALLAGKTSLVVITSQVSEAVTTFLLETRNQARFPMLAVKIPEPLIDRPATLADIATLVGGRVLLKVTGDSLHHIKPADLGGAAQAWVDVDYMGLVDGCGDHSQLLKHIAMLQANLDRCDDPDVRVRLLERMGKFVGGSALVWCGGTTDREIQSRKLQMEQKVSALRMALSSGVLPGGGVALLACQPALRRRIARATSTDERAAYTILLQAAEVLIRTLATNAGYDPGTVIAALQGKMPSHAFDMRSGGVVRIRQAGLYDGAAACKAAVRGAVTTAALALTIDVLVHGPRPETIVDPG